MGSDEEMASDSDSDSEESWETDSESEIPATEIVKRYLTKQKNDDVPKLSEEEEKNATSAIDVKREREMAKDRIFRY